MNITVNKKDFMISKIEERIKNSPFGTVEIDISNLNLINASRIALLSSVNIFTKYPNKKICWIIKDEETKKNISILKLKNMQLKVKEQILENKVYALK